MFFDLIHLWSRYFYALEMGHSEQEASAYILNRADTDQPLETPLKTRISYVNGSVEAACALGLADGIGKIYDERAYSCA